MMSRLVALSLLVLCAALVRPWPAAGQNNFEIQVYGSDTVAPGTTMVELHSNVATEGSRRTLDHVLRTQGAFHETLEITQGITSWFETGFYIFTSIQPDTTWEWVGNHIRPRVRAPESWHLPVGLSLSSELGYQRHAATGAAWIVPKKYIEKVGEDEFRRQPVGLGPYRFSRMTPGVELVLEANEQYWRKKPSIKRVV